MLDWGFIAYSNLRIWVICLHNLKKYHIVHWSGTCIHNWKKVPHCSLKWEDVFFNGFSMYWANVLLDLFQIPRECTYLCYHTILYSVKYWRWNCLNIYTGYFVLVIEESLSHAYEKARTADVGIFANKKRTPRKRISKERWKMSRHSISLIHHKNSST